MGVIESLISLEKMEHLSQGLEWNVIPSPQSTLHISHADREGENSKRELRENELLRRRAMDGNHHMRNNTSVSPTMGSKLYLMHISVSVQHWAQTQDEQQPLLYHHGNIKIFFRVKNLLIVKINMIFQCSTSRPKNEAVLH